MSSEQDGLRLTTSAHLLAVCWRSSPANSLGTPVTIVAFKCGSQWQGGGGVGDCRIALCMLSSLCVLMGEPTFAQIGMPAQRAGWIDFVTRWCSTRVCSP
jgi:hypothetical protein